MRILNLVDSVERINFGVWNAVISYFPHLINQDCQPEIWFRTQSNVPEEIHQVPWKSIKNKCEFNNNLSAYPINDTIVVSHGLWREPTFWGHAAKKLGYSWCVVPHGMLESWSMMHKWWKKYPYFLLIEQRMLARADLILAVGSAEYQNLKVKNKSCEYVSNGINQIMAIEALKDDHDFQFLFLSRLHKKKGVTELLYGWLQSDAHVKNARLIIAGPDEGEKEVLERILKENADNENSKLVNLKSAVYGNEKLVLLNQADFFILPSLSEGFPVAVLEAMAHGCYPLITIGCNFPEAFENNVAQKVSVTSESICTAINESIALSREEVEFLGSKAQRFVLDNYSLDALSEQLVKVYKNTLNR